MHLTLDCYDEHRRYCTVCRSCIKWLQIQQAACAQQPQPSVPTVHLNAARHVRFAEPHLKVEPNMRIKVEGATRIEEGIILRVKLEVYPLIGLPITCFGSGCAADRVT